MINIYGFKEAIYAQSELPDKLVSYNYNSFFRGMYNAYATHRPFTLSPDMLWLLIGQGFAHHINANPERLRDQFVAHKGKKILVINADNSPSKCDWEPMIADFLELVRKNTKGDIVEILECDFSTTTQIEKIASQATIMNSMQQYFEYIAIRLICGIPEVTLLGTTEDWERVLKRTKILAQYDLGWWTKEMIPVLKKNIKTTKVSNNSEIDTVFWRNMFKYHSLKQYGNPKVMDGWIVNFCNYSAPLTSYI